MALICDEDTATGLLLTGVGHVDFKKQSNYLIVDESEWAVRSGGRRGPAGGQRRAARRLAA